VPVGRELMLFGGSHFDRKAPNGKLHDDVWIWSPPARP
jgi:hypothetical protein